MKRLALIVAVLALAACDSGEQQELRGELKELTKDLRGKVDPLPVVKPYEPVPYTAFDLARPVRSGEDPACGEGFWPGNRGRAQARSEPAEGTPRGLSARDAADGGHARAGQADIRPR